jgi:hypothetical protein
MLGGIAMRALNGVGDATAGEWRDWTGKAYHVRRRLTAKECGDKIAMRDARQTVEASTRLIEAWESLHPMVQRAALEELGMLRFPGK